MGASDGGDGDLVNRGRNMQQGAGFLHHHQAVAGLERLRQFGRNQGHAVPAVGDRHAGGQGGELGGHARTGRPARAMSSAWIRVGPSV